MRREVAALGATTGTAPSRTALLSESLDAPHRPSTRGRSICRAGRSLSVLICPHVSDAPGTCRSSPATATCSTHPQMRVVTCRGSQQPVSMIHAPADPWVRRVEPCQSGAHGPRARRSMTCWWLRRASWPWCRGLRLVLAGVCGWCWPGSVSSGAGSASTDCAEGVPCGAGMG